MTQPKLTSSSGSLKTGKTPNLYLLLLLLLGLFANMPHASAKLTPYFTHTVSSKGWAYFTDSTTGGNVSRYHWSFGDGTYWNGIGPVGTPMHLYYDPGTYYACLTVYDSVANDSATYCDTIHISGCSANISYTWNQQKGNEYTFKGLGHYAHYYWKFGDGDTSSSQTVTHTYSSSGYYKITLFISDSSNTCSDSTSLFLNIEKCDLQARFWAFVSNKTVNFVDSSWDANHSYFTYYWDFGDGYTSYQSSPTHTYTTPGTYTACLTVSNISGCRDTLCRTVLIKNTNCNAAYTYKISGRNAYFTHSSGTGSSHYLWSFGDGTTSTQADPTHTFSADGTYTVCLVVSDSGGTCSDTTCQSVNISKCNLTTSFSWQHTGKFASFYAYTYTGGTPPVITWTFGDGTTGTGYYPSHIYSKTGTYRVCVSIYDSSSQCGASHCDTITITPDSTSCKAYFGAYPLSNNSVTFHRYYTSLTTNVRWDFGDGTTSTDTMVTHHYAASGKYLVCLTVYDTINNCSNTRCDSVEALQCVLKSNFSHYYTSGPEIQFSDYSYGHVSSRHWDFGDGTTSTDMSPAHTYTKAGKYTVCYSLYDSTTSCSDTYCDTVLVKKVCDASFNVSISGKKVTFTALYTNGTTRHTWSFGDNDSATVWGTAGQSISHTYSTHGTFHACLVTWDSATNCTTSYCMSLSLQGYKLSGIIVTKTGTTNQGHVYLITYNATDSSLAAIDTVSTYTDSAGYTRFVFNNVDPGTYYVKAALDSTDSLYSQYVPTYYSSSKKWKNADSIIVTSYNKYAYIQMKKGSNTGGPGFIGGKVSQGANKKEGDPVANVQVMVVDMDDNAVAYTYSDVDGNFAMPNLALGTYKVYAEILGLEPVEAELVLTAANPSINNVDIKVNTKSVVTSIWQPFDKRNAQPVTVYPNPSSGQVNLSLSSEKAAHATLYIYNYTGQAVLQQSLELRKGLQNIGLDVNTLPGGLYLIRLDAGQGTAAWEGRFIKN